MTRRKVQVLLVALLLIGAAKGWAQNGAIVTQKLDANGEGITVMRVWGTHHEMGYAQGNLLAKEIVAFLGEIKQTVGALYPLLKGQVGATIWPKNAEQEIDGMIAGIKAAIPGASLDKLDSKVANTYGDWINPLACRSHSSWGSFVKGATKTLSTRRLDYGLPASITGAKHHVLVARQPSDGSVRWVNMGWAGMVTAVTGVNEYGTLAALHDYKSKFKVGAVMPRMVAVRHALTLVKGLAPDKHLDAVFTALQQHKIMTNTFITYYVPEGHGGVLTCLAGQTCSKKRVPQQVFHNGEVLLTANTETDGKTAPADDTFMDGYYKQGGVKTIADHYALMGHTGMHLLSVDYRGRGDMTLWAEGRLSQGVTKTVKLQWKDLFTAAAPAADAGVGAADSGSGSDAGPYGGTIGGDAGDEGCAVGSGRGPLASAAALALVLALVVLVRRRSS